MAASAWALFNTAKKFIGDGTFDLNAATGGSHDFKCALLKSTYTPDLAHDDWSDISANEITVGIEFGYAAGGKLCTGLSYEQTSGTAKWVIDNPFWDASGGNIQGIRHAVIYHVTSGKLVCYSTLDASDITINDGQRLTIQISANGVFTNT